MLALDVAIEIEINITTRRIRVRDDTDEFSEKYCARRLARIYEVLSILGFGSSVFHYQPYLRYFYQAFKAQNFLKVSVYVDEIGIYPREEFLVMQFRGSARV